MRQIAAVCDSLRTSSKQSVNKIESAKKILEICPFNNKESTLRYLIVLFAMSFLLQIFSFLLHPILCLLFIDCPVWLASMFQTTLAI